MANNPKMKLQFVQSQLGHSDLRTTMGYVHFDTSDVIKGLDAIDM